MISSCLSCSPVVTSCVNGPGLSGSMLFSHMEPDVHAYDSQGLKICRRYPGVCTVKQGGYVCLPSTVSP